MSTDTKRYRHPPNSGVNTLTGEGLAEAIKGASVVVDVLNSPSFEEAAAMNFFTTATRNLLQYEQAAGVRQHVVLSVVGTDRLAERRPSDAEKTIRGYFRAKLAQEKLITESSIPFSIVHATQFFEFVKNIADASSDGTTVRWAPLLSSEEQRRLLEAFIGAAQKGDLATLEGLFVEDVVSYSDGGGIVRTAARAPVSGRDRVAKFIICFASHFWTGITLRWIETNGQASVLLSRGGIPVALATVDVSAQGINQIMWIMRPSKLPAISS